MVLRTWRKSGGALKLPPGPRKLPFVGNIHLFFNNLPHHCLRDLAKRYGPIVHLQFGEVPVYVLTSEETAKDVVKTHDLIFASKPRLYGLKTLTYNFTDVAMAPYGDYWRQVRKICVMELLNQTRVRSFRSIREEEVSSLLRDVSTNVGSVINMKKMLISLGLSITSMAAFGEKSKHQDEFKKLIPDILASFGGLALIDLYPSSKLLHLIQAIRPKANKLHQKVDEILECIIMDHRAKRANGWTERSDLVNVLLDLQENGELEIPLTTDNVKNIFAAGESPSIIMEWTMSAFMKNPRVMKRAQTEVRQVFSSGVDEARLDELKYLNAVIRETMRLYPSTPLLGPRESTERCEINGYEIPARSRVIINQWAVSRDPKYWTEAEKFLPERFLDSTKDFRGGCYKFLPFGAGRRMCPSITFGMAIFEMALANLLYHFDWKLPDGEKPEDLDMTEVMKAIVRRKHDLHLVPIPCHPIRSDQ